MITINEVCGCKKKVSRFGKDLALTLFDIKTKTGRDGLAKFKVISISRENVSIKHWRTQEEVTFSGSEGEMIVIVAQAAMHLCTEKTKEAEKSV